MRLAWTSDLHLVFLKSDDGRALQSWLEQLAAEDFDAIAISGEKTYYRTVDLPASALKEIENVLPFELEAQLPFEMTEAVFDYRIDKRVLGSETVPIFSAIARTGDVRERIHVVREALGLEPKLVRGDPDNIKITLPEDIERAARLLRSWSAA